MRIWTTCVLAIVALTVSVPAATSGAGRLPASASATRTWAPDGYQPQLRTQPGSAGAAAHPDSQAVRPGVVVDSEPMTSEGLSFSWAGASRWGQSVGGGLIALLAIAGASAMRERRHRLVLH